MPTTVVLMDESDVLSETMLSITEVLSRPPGFVEPATTIDDIGADELDLMEVVMDMESRLNSPLSEDCISEVWNDQSSTVSDLAAAIYKCYEDTAPDLRFDTVPP